MQKKLQKLLMKNTQRSKNLIFGIIGYGSIGKVHEKILKELNYKTYIYDPFFKKNKNFLPLKNINKFCDAIIIASPSNTHIKYLKFFADKKKHIFIEKPFSHEIKQTKKIIKIYKKYKKIIGINYNLRSRKSIICLKQILSKVKKIYWANFIMSSNVLRWRKRYNFKYNYTHSNKAGGIIFDSIHEIDLNTFLFKKIKFVNSFVGNYNKRIFKKSSFSSINLNINNKFLSHIQLDYIGNPDQRKIEILCDIGLIRVDIKKNTIIINNKNNKIIFNRKFKKEKNIDYKNMIKNFITCIENNKKKIICSPDDAIKNINIAMQANE